MRPSAGVFATSLRAGALLALLALAPGCAGPSPGPRAGPTAPGSRLSPKEERLAALERETSYEGHWQAALLLADLAEERARDRDERQALARKGIEHADQAIRRKADGVEGHYARAVCIGMLLDAERLPTLSLVPVLRDEGEHAAKLDEAYEHGGPRRLLGLLYSDAPSIGSVGDEELAETNLRRLLEIAGDWPENHLAWAHFLLKVQGDSEAARKAAETAKKLIDTTDELDAEQRRKLHEEADHYLAPR